MMRMRKWLALGLLLVLVATLAPLALAQDVPSVVARDQAIQNNSVTVERAWSAGDGWVDIHVDNNGSPGTIIGATWVHSGLNENVVVQLNLPGQQGAQTQPTPRLWAMLHIDAGQAGVHEYPNGPDVPVTELNGQPVMAWFSVTGGLPAQQTATVTATAAAAPQVTSTVAATVTAAAVVTGTPQSLPVTGSASAPWTSVLLLVVGGLVAALGLGLAFARR